MQIWDIFCIFACDFGKNAKADRLIAILRGAIVPHRWRKVGAAQSTAAVNGRRAAMFGHCYRDEIAFGNAVAQMALGAIKATRASALPTTNTLLVCVGDPK